MMICLNNDVLLNLGESFCCLLPFVGHPIATGCNRGFHKHTELTIMAILASEALLHENKKIKYDLSEH